MKEEAKLAVAYSICFEGCISLLRGKREEKGKLYIHYTPYISICGVNRSLLDSFCSLSGYGKVSNAQKSNSSKHRKAYRWELYRQKDVKLFLEEILLYLPAKQEQARLLIEYCDLRLKAPHPHSDGIYKSTYTGEEEEIWLEMKELNRRGEWI